MVIHVTKTPPVKALMKGSESLRSRSRHMSIIPARDERSFQAALDLLDGARSSAVKAASPVLTSWVVAVEAEIYALAGDTAALSALDHAQSALERVVPEEIPPWLDYYDAQRLEGCKGFDYLQLGRPDEARLVLEGALASLGPSAVKQRGVVSIDLATAYVHLGELEEACRLAGQVAELLRLTGYATSAQCLQSFRVQVAPWHNDQMVKDLDEQLALLPARRWS